MAEFISSFITGFDAVVERILPKVVPGCKIIKMYDGLVHYQYTGDVKRLYKVEFLNNTFNVLKNFRKGMSFGQMIAAVGNRKHHYMIYQGTYRVRFTQGNQFAKVDKQLSIKAENIVKMNSQLKLDRVNPETEMWYILRNDGVGFYGQLLHKRENTEKNLHKGELRPEFAYLMCSCAEMEKEDVVCDPFCGYGAIPRQLLKHWKCSKVLISDIEKEKVEALKKTALGRNQRASIVCADAMNLKHIGDYSVDIIVTDPPWGYYEEIEDIHAFYMNMFAEFRRILSYTGYMVILSARKEELERAAGDSGAVIEEAIHTLVNGKKAAVYVLHFE